MGHTHIRLDGSFGVLTRHVYGSQRGGTTGRDLLSFSGFDKVTRCFEFLENLNFNLSIFNIQYFIF